MKNLEKLMGSEFQLQVEPIIPIKKDKKKVKLTIAIIMGFDKTSKYS